MLDYQVALKLVDYLADGIRKSRLIVVKGRQFQFLDVLLISFGRVAEYVFFLDLMLIQRLLYETFIVIEVNLIMRQPILLYFIGYFLLDGLQLGLWSHLLIGVVHMHRAWQHASIHKIAQVQRRARLLISGNLE